ncbi:MAG: DegV family protein [Lachnospiraceae bacterium]|nr:DegV family protein [Lachnospiraceae bacterium]
MNKIRIITDSASDITAENFPNLTVLPMSVRFGEDEYLDRVTLSPVEFYEKLIESDELPATSLVSPAAFQEAFQEAIDAGDSVLAITISAHVSGTWQSAMVAAADYPGKVFVIDSMSVSVGEQTLVLRALELLQEGETDAGKLAEQLEREKQDMHIIAVLDSLEYLKKGGRISSTAAFVGGMLSIKPVVSVLDGKVALIGKARGSRNVNNYLMKEISSTPGIDFTRPLGLGYTGLTDTFLQKYIKDSESLWRGHEDCLRISHLGAAIGTHVGPGAIALAFFAKTN